MAIVNRVELFKCAGVLIGEIQYKDVPHCDGEVRVYSQYCDRLEFSADYINLSHRRRVIGQALVIASHALDTEV